MIKTLKQKILFVILLVLISCESDNLTTNTNSKDIPSSEKLSFLEKYIGQNKGILDAEYTIWYQDNSSGMVPGPSDFTIIAALKVEKDSLHLWNDKSPKSNKKIDISIWKGLGLDSTWRFLFLPECYHNNSGSRIKVIYPNDGIVLIRNSSMPYQELFDSTEISLNIKIEKGLVYYVNDSLVKFDDLESLMKLFAQESGEVKAVAIVADKDIVFQKSVDVIIMAKKNGLKARVMTSD